MFRRWYDEEPLFRYILPAIIAGGAALAGAGIMAGSAGAANASNRKLANEQFWRNDNAVQIRARDLRAAGFNPVLAAGDAAGSPTPISQSPTVTDNVGSRVAGAAINAMQAKEQLANVREQTELLKRQQESVSADTMNKYTDGIIKSADAQFAMDYYRGRAGLPGSSAALNNARASTLSHDLALARNTGLPTSVMSSNMGPSGVPAFMAVKATKDVVEGAGKVVSTLKDKAGKAIDTIRGLPDAIQQEHSSWLRSQEWFRKLPDSEQSVLLGTELALWPKDMLAKYLGGIGKNIFSQNNGASRSW